MKFVCNNMCFFMIEKNEEKTNYLISTKIDTHDVALFSDKISQT